MNAYPLSWPEGWPRTPNGQRVYGRFGKRVASTGSWKRLEDLTITQALQRVLGELERMGIDRQDIIVSTNVRTRLDGMPRSGEREPDDRGVAIYWQQRDGQRRVMAIDLYTKVADNLAAIAATLEAMRAIERHGGARVLERAFTGFTALPSPQATREWWEVLGVVPNATADEIRAAYRRMASTHHPDRGGDAATMADVNAAYQRGLQAAT